jgi:DNA-binding NarL/FixJ family response regulator
MRMSIEPPWPADGSASSSGPAHICIAGKISDDWEVVRRLKQRHQVTLVRQPVDLAKSTVLSTASVLAIDCGDSPESGLITLALVSRLYPQLRVVLVNGRLSQGEIAEAFRRGACDYLSSQVDPELTAERIESLCRRSIVVERSLPE